MIASAYAIGITPKIKLRERINIFSRGAGDENIMLMIWIFVLAGAFAMTASKMGAIDATVNLTLRLLPASMLLPGLFLAACFISLSIGTSVGTVVALTPVAVGIAELRDCTSEEHTTADADIPASEIRSIGRSTACVGRKVDKESVIGWEHCAISIAK